MITSLLFDRTVERCHHPESAAEAAGREAVGERGTLQPTVVPKKVVEGTRAEDVFAEDAHAEDEVPRLCDRVLGDDLQHLLGRRHHRTFLVQLHLVALFDAAAMQRHDQRASYVRHVGRQEAPRRSEHQGVAVLLVPELGTSSVGPDDLAGEDLQLGESFFQIWIASLRA